MKILSVASVTIFLLCGCDGVTSRSGKILDHQENPVSDAEIILHASEDRKSISSSDSDGLYKAHVTHAPGRFKLDFSVKKEGFQDYYVKIQSNSHYDEFDVVLEPAP